MRRIHILIVLALLPLSLSAVDSSKKNIDFFLDPVIPHFAVGGSEWQTTFIFHNPSDTLEKFYLNFTDDDGKPLPIPALGNSRRKNDGASTWKRRRGSTRKRS